MRQIQTGDLGGKGDQLDCPPFGVEAISID